MLNGLVSHPHVAVKNQEGYLCCRNSRWRVRPPNPQPGSTAQGSRARKRSPVTLAVKTSRDHGWVTLRAPGVPAVLLKRAHTQRLNDGLTCSELLHWGSSSEGVRDIWEGTELSDFRARSGDAAFSQTEELVEAIFPLLSPPSTEPAGGKHIWVSINLANTIHPTLVIPWDSTPPNLLWLYHAYGMSLLMLQTFLKSFKGSHNSKQAASDPSVPDTSFQAATCLALMAASLRFQLSLP